ncbi:collagen alpha-5(VI) chain-like [Argonauta hians]
MSTILLRVGLVFMTSLMVRTLAANPAYFCLNGTSDVVFVLDSSTSIWAPFFENQIEFVQYFIDRMDIGENKVRVGVVTFSKRAIPWVYLSDSYDKQELKDKVTNIVQERGITETALALELLTSTMFTYKGGSRSNARRVAFILTDGSSQEAAKTQKAAERCRNSNIELFAIGIGNETNPVELRGIASSPKDSHYIHVSNYPSLINTKSEIYLNACKAITEPPQNVQRVCTNTSADVFFLLDSSSSIQKDEFTKQLNIVEDIVKRYSIGADKIRIGLSVFSNQYQSVIDFNNMYQKSDVIAKIRNTPYIGGSTKTGYALRRIREEIFNRNSRRKRFIIIFTDGQSEKRNQTIHEASLLKQNGVNIFMVGVGPFVDENEMDLVSSWPSSEYVYGFEDMDELARKVEQFSSVTCEVIGKQRDAEKVCSNTIADVFFLLDSSSSIEEDDFKKQLNSVVYLIRTYSIGINKTRIAVSVFSTGYKSVIVFKNGVKISEIVTKIGNTPYMGGTTGTGNALRKIREGIFNEKSTKKRFIIIFTDGRSNDREQTINEAEFLKQNGVVIFSVVVGPRGDRQEMDLVSTRPSNEYVYQFADMDELWRKIKTLSTATCRIIEKPWKSQEYCSSNSSRITEVAFGVSNNYIGHVKTAKILKAIDKVINSAYLSQRFRFGILFDRCHNFHDVSFINKDSTSIIERQMIHHHNHPIKEIINKLVNFHYSPSFNRKIALIFVDESFALNNPFGLERTMQELSRKNIQVFVVGIGNNLDVLLQLQKLVGRSNIIHVNSYEDLMLVFRYKFAEYFCPLKQSSSSRADLS